MSELLDQTPDTAHPMPLSYGSDGQERRRNRLITLAAACGCFIGLVMMAAYGLVLIDSAWQGQFFGTAGQFVLGSEPFAWFIRMGLGLIRGAILVLACLALGSRNRFAFALMIAYLCLEVAHLCLDSLQRIVQTWLLFQYGIGGKPLAPVDVLIVSQSLLHNLIVPVIIIALIILLVHYRTSVRR
jgi:hypothetical protein